MEEILGLFWCCSVLMIILTGCHLMYVISAMLGVKKNEEIAAEAERGDAARAITVADQLVLEGIPELFWCCTGLQITQRGYSPAYRWHVPGYPSAA